MRAGVSSRQRCIRAIRSIPSTVSRGSSPNIGVTGDGRILIGQFSSSEGLLISGMFLIQFVSDGEVYQSYESFNSPSLPCPWDCGDFDGVVTPIDFLALLAQWGEVDVPCDINGNGVGVTDVLAMLANWGGCP